MLKINTFALSKVIVKNFCDNVFSEFFGMNIVF